MFRFNSFMFVHLNVILLLLLFILFFQIFLHFYFLLLKGFYVARVYKHLLFKHFGASVSLDLFVLSFILFQLLCVLSQSPSHLRCKTNLNYSSTPNTASCVKNPMMYTPHVPRLLHCAVFSNVSASNLLYSYFYKALVELVGSFESLFTILVLIS